MVGSPSWAGYFSRNYPKFQGILPACIGLFILIEVLGRNSIYPLFGTVGPVAELANFGVWMGLYVMASRHYRSVSTWYRDTSRKDYLLTLLGSAALATLLIIMFFTPIGRAEPVMLSGLVGAAWLLIYKGQIGKVWDHYMVMFPYLLIISVLSMLNAGPYPGSSLSVFLIGCAGLILTVFGIVEARMFQRSINGRLGES